MSSIVCSFLNAQKKETPLSLCELILSHKLDLVLTSVELKFKLWKNKLTSQKNLHEINKCLQAYKMLKRDK